MLSLNLLGCGELYSYFCYKLFSINYMHHCYADDHTQLYTAFTSGEYELLAVEILQFCNKEL